MPIALFTIWSAPSPSISQLDTSIPISILGINGGIDQAVRPACPLIRYTGYYSLRVSTTGGGSAWVTPAASEGEPDNSSGAARAITVGTAYDRYLTSGDQDWFTFTAP